MLGRRGLLKGRTIAIDATTLEANAALRSIVRKDDGQTYDAFLTGLSKAALITAGCVVRAMLACLGLPTEPPSIHPARGPPESGLA